MKLKRPIIALDFNDAQRTLDFYKIFRKQRNFCKRSEWNYITVQVKI